MLLDNPIRIGHTHVSNRLVMPPMQTNKTDRGHVTEELVQYYRDRAVLSRPGIIITEHSCITESGRAAEAEESYRKVYELTKKNPHAVPLSYLEKIDPKAAEKIRKAQEKAKDESEAKDDES